VTEAAGSSGNRTEEAVQRAGGHPGGLSTRWLHLTVLSSLAVAQPLLDLLGRYPEYFVAQDIGRGGLLALAAALLILPPLPFVAAEASLLRTPRWLQQSVHLVFVGVFAALFALLMLKRIVEFPTLLVLVCAALLAALAILIYRKSDAVRSLVTLMAIGLVVIPTGFLIKVRSAGLMSPAPSPALQVGEVGCTEPIVVLVFDEFSTSVLLDERGAINRKRYPNLAALADTATWYPRAVSVAEYTMHAVPAILSGRIPRRGTMPIVKDHPNNLFTLFGSSYDIWALETMTRLCPPEMNLRGTDPERRDDRAMSVVSDLKIVYLHLIVPEAAVDRLPPISDTWGGFGDRAVATPSSDTPKEDEPLDLRKIGHQETTIDRRSRALELKRALASCGDRRLYFLHVMLPHGPWDLLPDGQRYPAETGAVWGVNREDNSWPEDEFLPMQAYQRYILQTMYVDRFVGDVRRTLEDLGVFDRTLIVLVADHGVSFKPGTRRRNAWLDNAHEILPVPLLIKGPHQRTPRVVDHLVSIVDILPTVVRLLGVEVDWEFEGSPQTGADVAREHPIEFMVHGSGFHEVFPEYLEEMDLAVSSKLDAFGDGTEPLDLYRIGRHPDLIGRKIDELPSGQPLDTRVSIDDSEMYESVNLAVGTLPVFVQGSVRGAEPQGEGLQLAVAVNGTIGAVVPTHPNAEPWGRFTAMIPPWFLVSGENRIEVYVVEGRVGSETLHALVKR
jgi:hypothetical protein